MVFDKKSMPIVACNTHCTQRLCNKDLTEYRYMLKCYCYYFVNLSQQLSIIYKSGSTYTALHRTVSATTILYKSVRHIHMLCDKMAEHTTKLSKHLV